ncbi:hypothetical protein THAOC_13997 [Thalassiosira oceanica]|uniref:Uncharacterized protein n=1 Tax=Thalassiosira oceanica TaxID=159749 RepID=K0SJR6_THAOC|nr:hypothetical protein THAOC_13997 [Thalassiosira oceanica]|eukprot:EJK65179.1 hypothetical protein THAOC_13997 [Thalassiosira oceanica]
MSPTQLRAKSNFLLHLQNANPRVNPDQRIETCEDVARCRQILRSESRCGFVLPLGIEGPAFHSQERNRPHARQSSGGPIPNFREDKDDHPKLTAEVRKFPQLEGEAEISAVRVEQHESDASVAHPRLGYRSRPIHHWAYCGGSASLVRSGSVQRSRNKARPRLSEARRACSGRTGIVAAGDDGPWRGNDREGTEGRPEWVGVTLSRLTLNGGVAARRDTGEQTPTIERTPLCFLATQNRFGLHANDIDAARPYHSVKLSVSST